MLDLQLTSQDGNFETRAEELHVVVEIAWSAIATA